MSCEDIHTEGDGHMKTEAEIGIIVTQDKEQLKVQNLEEAKE